jgi:hypothetical protein
MDNKEQNGRSFKILMSEADRYLQQLHIIDYYRQPMPSVEDENLETMVERFMAANPRAREQFQARLTTDQRALFGIYGHRAATLGVREGSPARLLSGLVGAAIANYQIPEKRNVEVALAIFYHCAHRLGLDTAEIFAQAAEFAAEEIGCRMRAFGKRTDVTLQKYGWREFSTPRGVRYRFDWR